MDEGTRFASLSPEVRVAWYGALFSMSLADGRMHRQELLTILDRLDPDGLPPEHWLRVRRFIADPPPFEEALQVVVGEPAAVRFGLMFHLVDVVLADDVFHEAERERLEVARSALGIDEGQLERITTFARRLRALRDTEADDEEIANAAGLAELGLPPDVVLR